MKEHKLGGIIGTDITTMDKLKLYCYADETGQHTQGQIFSACDCTRQVTINKSPVAEFAKIREQ